MTFDEYMQLLLGIFLTGALIAFAGMLILATKEWYKELRK